MLIEDVDLASPRPNEMLVRLVATGICHTDIVAASADSIVPRPVVLGHEGAGVIEEVGKAVTGFAPGDHVVLSYNSCGTCPSCVDHAPAYCFDMVPLNFGARRQDGTSPSRRAASRYTATSLASPPSRDTRSAPPATR